ncbi:GumL protein [Microbacterium nanhaiense]|uniref:GumL protein n=1 Tax=Microbacterium nanhaiense TaxID=1301026 RepID=A0ABQ2N3A6_9MICO|nr:polysaccharide pyruvyl transferase family protein [Microbacterium nanhaiense]GGO66940.1 GumL protein [Microbacterium nanhaiense]
MPIDLYSWQYRPPLLNLPVIRRIRKRAVPNFGDEIGPLVVDSLLRERGIDRETGGTDNARLFSVGSVMHFVRPGDHVWGTGINAKRPMELVDMKGVVVHAVRGPRTAAVLENNGVDVPKVFGDPGLLIKHVPSLRSAIVSEKSRSVALIPNFNDMNIYRGHPDLVSPLQTPEKIVAEISRSELVVGSSLHAMVFADALGVPARLIKSVHEHPFKYEDYYLGSGRDPQQPAETVEAAVRAGGSDPLSYDESALVEALPYNLFVRDSNGSTLMDRDA